MDQQLLADHLIENPQLLLARRLVEEVRPTTDRHTITFVESDQPIVLLGDELRLEQVGVGPDHHRDVNVGVLERTDGVQSSEPAPDHHDPVPRRCCR